jgi:hypothetical protein
MKERFTEIIKLRSGKTLKNNLVYIAGLKQKDYSDIVRDACADYIARHYSQQHGQNQFNQAQRG